MNDCIFCKIVKGEIPSKTIYENEEIKVMMDINPETNGHLLLIPKKHYENIFDMDEKLIMDMLKIIKTKLYPLVSEKLGCEGMTICQNNLLGQDVKHFHIHLIPRYQDDKMTFSTNKEIIKELEEVYAKLTEK